MRIAAAIVVLLCALLTGLELLRRRSSACELLSQAADFCLFMQSSIRYEQPEPEKMIREYPSEAALFAACRTEIAEGRSFAEAWNESVRGSARYLSAEEAELILRMGSELGRTDISGELLRLEHVYSRLDGLCRRRSAALESDRRLYLSVSLLSGVFITILMI